ncbi:MAG: hypothetical protein DYG98_09790 [Haliscomenobacteraceae bacterium CHB4]|nr:hypothetical protein [Saprospiraceae bacterium]MCE7923339.1 hypothetical protein [Haliscomenobacteraceae bacterium CHB4]
MVTKYALVQNVVNRLTDDPTFRTFFTLYLMAEGEAERNRLDERFWKEADQLPEPEQQLLRAELTRCFLRLPMLTNNLLERASTASAAP